MEKLPSLPMLRLSVLIGLSTATLPAQYIVQVLSAPVDQPTYTTITPYALNNMGQVYGRALLPGVSGGPRVPVLWTNDVGHSLPIPAGYTWHDGGAGGNLALNESGVVAAEVSDSGGARHIIVWTNGVPSLVPLIPPCAGHSPSGQVLFGMNRAGHILGFSGNFGDPCSFYWVYNGAAFQALPEPAPNNTCLGLKYIVDAPGRVLNDADHVAMEEYELGGCLLQPFLFSPPSGINFLPAVQGYGVQLNNHDQMLVFQNGASGPDDYFWDGSALHDLHGAPAFLNSMGQVAYTVAGGAVFLWSNGATAPIVLPNGVTGGLEGFNDAAQLLIGSFLLSPSGSCSQNVTAQVQVTRGGFRLNHATQHYTQTITVTNPGSSTIAGPISIALDNVPASATLFNLTGATLCNLPNGNPFMDVTAGPLAPGASATATIDFINVSNAGITYAVRVLAGSGER